MVHLILAVSLFVVVLVLVTVRPRNLSIGWSAAGGGAAALLLGIVSWANVWQVASVVWDATLTFVALIVISLVLDGIGFFHWAALEAARRAGTRGLQLFFWMGLLGAVVAMFFANDGAALILTPLVYEQAKALGFDGRATLAFIMASGFIADTTSLPLVVSNLVNIVSADYFHLGFISFAVRMVPVDLLALGASLAALWLFYRRAIPPRVDTHALPDPWSAVKDRRLFRRAWYVLAALLLGYFLSQILHWPVSIFAGSAALALLIMAIGSPALRVPTVVKEAPWNIVVFSLGMYVVVYGLKNVGLTSLLGHQLSHLAAWGTWTAVVGTGFMAAVLSSVMNNLPSVLINALAIHGASASHSLKTAMAYANVIGCDLGPKMTPIGSLATLLWLYVLARRGVSISWGYYMKVGILLTVPVLLVTLTGLWAWSALVG